MQAAAGAMQGMELRGKTLAWSLGGIAEMRASLGIGLKVVAWTARRPDGRCRW